jgi:integrase
MSKYISCAAGLFDKFEHHRLASDKWSNTAESNLKLFDKYCAREYPEAKALTQTMVDGWCGIRGTESPASCKTRIQVVISCLKYLQKRNVYNDITLPEMSCRRKSYYLPHGFTDKQLKEFFKACDSIELKKLNLVSRLRKLQVPVFFRLLLSSGIMRTIEARLLRVEDVDLKTGVINIRKSKGHDQHYEVLDDSMLEILRRYNEIIGKSSLCPYREYFFSSHLGKPHSRYWVSDNFRALWNSELYGRAIPYELHYPYLNKNLTFYS